MKAWWHRLRYRECQACRTEFKKFKPILPSLVGYSFCSRACEGDAWAGWAKGETA